MRSAQSIIKRPLLTEKSARLRETGGGAAAGKHASQTVCGGSNLAPHDGQIVATAEVFCLAFFFGDPTVASSWKA